MDVLKHLQTELAKFASERDWNQFHTPRISLWRYLAKRASYLNASNG